MCKQVKIQESLANNKKFIFLDDDGIVTKIQKDDSEFVPYFFIHVVSPESTHPLRYFVDSIVYNRHTKEIGLLNTRNETNSVVAVSKLCVDDMVLLYSFGVEEILIVFDRTK